MEIPVTSINLASNIATDKIAAIFESIRFSHGVYRILRAVNPPVEKLDTLYTDNISGLALKIWGVPCTYNEYGRFTIVKTETDDRRCPSFSSMLHALPNYHRHEHTGSLLYRKEGFMGWHTNYDSGKPENVLDLRIYITYNEDDNSIFKYIDSLNRVIEVKEPKGWSIKIFDVTYPFWHCIVSGKHRVSLGTRLLLEK